MNNKNYSRMNISKLIVRENKSEYITYEDYENEIEKNSCVILDGYSDRKALYCRNGITNNLNGEVNLTTEEYSFLCDVMLGKDDFEEHVTRRNYAKLPVDPEVAFRQKVSRLNRKFRDKNISDELFTIKTCDHKPKCVTNLPMIILRAREED